MSVARFDPPPLGYVGEVLAEAIARKRSEKAIDMEIAYLLQVQAQGERNPALAVYLHDWRTIRATQRRLRGER